MQTATCTYVLSGGIRWDLVVLCSSSKAEIRPGKPSGGRVAMNLFLFISLKSVGALADPGFCRGGVNSRGEGADLLFGQFIFLQKTA